MRDHPTQQEMENLYRAVADGDPRQDVLQMLYDMFADQYDLRPPMAEMRLADRCKPGNAHG